MDLLTRSDILDAPEADTIFEDVSVPEWGGVVRVRALNGTERDRFEESLFTGKGRKRKMTMANARARLVALSVIDQAGDSLFTEQDIAALGRKSAVALDRVFSVASRLAGITDRDMEEITENFTPGLNGDSISD